MNRFIVFILAGMMASGALADDHSASGDASAGEVAFNKQCVACHVVVTDAGEKLAGRNSKSGPNLYNVAGATAGAVPGYRYGKSLVKAGRRAGFDLDRRDVFGLCPRPKGFLKGVSRR
jgi:cytochrome c